MKKVICLILFSFVMIFSISFANNLEPQYDATRAMLYANGNNIVIDENGLGETVVSWETGSYVVPQNVGIVGGGIDGTSFSNSKITMNGGNISQIYGGGLSVNENLPANVTESNIIINDGTILKTIYGGGVIYSNTREANITINGGNINAVCGGGSASKVIDGISYSAGSATDLVNSKNRVNSTKITINDGVMNIVPMSSDKGLVFGGGQGYSYTGTAELVINGGDLSYSYVTAGGSNGYTGRATVTINNGILDFLQTVNRGKMERATVKINGGVVTNAYVGGESSPSTATGIIDAVKFFVLNGKVENLYPGISDEIPIVINSDNYTALLVGNHVINNNLGGGETSIDYTFKIADEKVKVFKESTIFLNTNLITRPSGYEYVFSDVPINWSILDDSVASISENGTIAGKNIGKTIVTANFLDSSDIIQVEVQVNVYDILLITISVVLVGVLTILIIR